MSDYTIDDIISLYITAKDKDMEVFILAQLTASDPETIIEVLKDYNIYQEKGIQPCVNCGELYICENRRRTCPTCYNRRKRDLARLRYHSRKELR